MVFPEGFLWGVSISGFQFEMGDREGRNVDPNTDWYAWVHDSNNIRRGLVSGDLPENGVNYWELYKRDHRIAERLGLNAYRIGVEWSRIFPRATFKVEVDVDRDGWGKISRIHVDGSALERLDEMADKKAVEHYRAVVEDLRSRGFKVFVCLNHFTLPLWIHDPITARDTRLRRGPRGWVDEETLIEFTKYCAYVAWRLGDLVDEWATFNEPMVVPEAGYMTTQSGFPPGVTDFKALRRAAIHMAVAHARAYDAIKRWDTVKADEDSSSPADIGLIHNVIPIIPLDEERGLDVKAAEFLDRLHNHFFLKAVSEGWLDRDFNGVRDKGEVRSDMRGRLDWLGVNYYTRHVVKGRRSILARLILKMTSIPELANGYGFSCKPNSVSADGRPTSDFGWEVYPEGLLKALKAVVGYGKPLYLTENGIADAEDKLRPTYIVEHLKVLDEAINLEGIPVRGYLHWSLTDNYEWAKGFRMKFGLYSVDLETKRRSARRSARLLKKIIEEGGITRKVEREVNP
ncbi:glycoside hydrolase family 1 protein [Candidatus Bathyarchaeota archaeon]|nr:MAG: glycoside hydrolase family 1 protein [Candidatus Bathyarchaeota archaeon]